MTEIDVKNALTHYHKYKKSFIAIRGKIEAIEVQQTKTGGSVVKMPDGHTDNEQRKLGLIERKTMLEKDLDRYAYYVHLADHFTKSLQEPYQSLVRNKYIDKIESRKLEEVYHYSRQGIAKIINKLIERYIEAT